jgi:hypothetical protein
LESLERLNDNFSSFSYQQTDDSQAYQDEVEGVDEDNPFIDIQQDLVNLTNPASAAGLAAENDNESDVVDYDSQLDLNTDVKGPKINEKVAGVVNKLCLQRISQEQSKAIMKRHNPPENIKLRLPKVEPSIWNEIPGKTRVNDLKFQSTQAILLASVNCQLEVAESLLKSNAGKEVLTTCLDGITLAMTSNYELNQRRRDAMRP